MMPSQRPNRTERCHLPCIDGFYESENMNGKVRASEVPFLKDFMVL